MNTAVSSDQLTEAVLALPRAAKATLLALIQHSLAEEDHSGAEAYDAEIKRRIASTDRGDTVLLTHEEVQQRLGPKYGKKAD